MAFTGQKSIAYQKLVLNGLASGLSSHANLFFALFTTAPSVGSDTVVEVSGGSYARISKSTTGLFTAATQTGTDPSQMVLNADVLFATPTADWGTVHAFGIYTASSGGTLTYFGLINDPTGKVISNGGPAFSFPIGSIIITES